MKITSVLSLFVFLLFVSATPANATLLVIKSDGFLEWKVLSAKDEVLLAVPKPESIGIEKAADLSGDSTSMVNLDKSGDKISLTVTNGGKVSDLDVTNWKENLVEIEEKPEVQKIAITIRDGKFLVRQKGVAALTDFPLTIDSKTSEMSAKTSTGNKYLSVLPFDAVQSFLRTKLVNKVDVGNLEILDKDDNLAYKIPGEKVFNFFDLYYHSIPISSYVSASTGELLAIDGPKWLNVINYLL